MPVVLQKVLVFHSCFFQKWPRINHWEHWKSIYSLGILSGWNATCDEEEGKQWKRGERRLCVSARVSRLCAAVLENWTSRIFSRFWHCDVIVTLPSLYPMQYSKTEWKFRFRKNQDCNNVIYAFATQDVFQLLNSKHSYKNLVVSCSYLEIYGGTVFDLLSGKSKLKVLEDGKQQVRLRWLQFYFHQPCSGINFAQIQFIFPLL